MSYTTFVEKALQTADEFGISKDKLAEFEKSLVEKLKNAPESKFVYTAEFLQAFKSGLDYQGKQNKRKPPREYKPFAKSNIKLTERSENAWKPSHVEKTEEDPNISLIKTINSDLNKLTESNYDTISTRVIDKLNEDILNKFVEIMFSKAVWDAKYRNMYAQICLNIQKKYKNFRRSLITQCQIEFNRIKPVRLPEQDSEDYEYEIVKWKKRRLGNIHFIVELLKLKMIHSKVILACSKELLNHDINNPLNDNIFHASELLIIVKGVVKDETMKPVVDRLLEFLNEGKLGSREKFKIQDAVKLYK